MDRKLKKISEKKFVLETYDKENDLRTEKGYKREELRQIYDSLKMQFQQVKQRRTQIEMEKTKLDVEETPQLREFASKLDAAQKLLQFDKLTFEDDKLKEDVALFNKQMKEISGKVPEVLRNK